MIHTVTLNACLDRTLTVSALVRGGLNRVVGSRLDPAGKGINVSRVLAALGAPSVPFAFLAGQAGRLIYEATAAAGLHMRVRWLDGETRTNLKLLEPGGILTEVNESGPSVSPEALCDLLNELEAALEPGDWVIASGSLPPGLGADAYARIVQVARRAGARSLIDADDEPMLRALAEVPDAAKPNAYELSKLLGRAIPEHDPDAAASGARELLARGLELVCVSLGSGGAVLATPAAVVHAWSDPVRVGSPVGCGDTLAAGMLWGLSLALSPERLAAVAVACATAKAQKPGTELPTVQEMEAALALVHSRVL